MPETLPAFSLRTSASSLERSPKWTEKNAEIPLEFAIAHDATLWMLIVDAFRAEEERLMVEGKYETTLADHRAELSQIIARGEQILFLATKVELPPVADFTLDDLRATLESLHVTFRHQYGPKNHPDTNKRIRALLDVSEPED